MNIGTPYDDVFRTLLNDCSRLIIPVINEIFGEHYTGEEDIVFLPNEHFMNQEDGSGEKRFTDSNFRIISVGSKKYHWECQSTPDKSMLVRFFEYDTQIALDEGEVKGNRLTVTFPHSAVLFLRCDTSTPGQMKIQMITPGGTVCYGIPVMKSQSYSINEIFEKKLLFLIPFHIFSHEKYLKEYDTNFEKLETLKKEYAKIRKRLEELQEAGVIDAYTKATLIDMSNKVLEGIARRYENVREGVKAVMGGKVLEYEAKTILRKGISEGILSTLCDLVQKNLLSVKDAAEQAGMSEEAFIAKMQAYRKQN